MIINYIHKLNDPINAQLKENVRKFLIILFSDWRPLLGIFAF